MLKISSCFIMVVFCCYAINGFSQKTTVVKSNTKKDVAAVSKPAVGAYVVYDTIQAGWVEAAPGEIKGYKDLIITDNMGTMYARVETGPGDSRYCYLQNGQWKILEWGEKEEVKYVHRDIAGNVFAILDGSKIYKKTGSQWKYVAGDSNRLYDISVQPAERFYGLKRQAGTEKMILMRWQGKYWEAVTHANGLLDFTNFPKMVADKKGCVYFSTAENAMGSIVKCLAGNELKTIGEMPEAVSQIGIDEEGSVYAYGEKSFKGYFKKWNGVGWSDVALPAGLSKYVYPNIEYSSGKIHLNGLTDVPGSNERACFTLQKGVWVKVSSYDFKKEAAPPIILNGEVYSIKRNSNVLFKKETGRIIRREIYPFNYQQDITITTELKALMNGFRQVKAGNKFGIINSNGETVIFATADQISICKDPFSILSSAYAFDLLLNGTHYYTSVHSGKYNPFKLPAGAREEKNDKCKACNGMGTVGGINKTETVPGKKYDGYTSTTTRPSTMGGYQTTTITTPAYQEPSTTRVTGKTAIVNCNKCRGKGAFVKGWKDYLEYNAITKTYSKKRIDYGD